MAESSRDRILAEALRLFGEQGYAGTSIAQIEKAAGLSPGSGALYRHFKSKDELLVQGLAGPSPGPGPVGTVPFARFLGARDAGSRRA